MMGCSMPNNSVIAVFTRSSCFSVALFFSMNDFQKPRGPHAATDTHGDNGIFRLAPTALNQSVAGQPRSSHAVGMPDCDRAAIDVELFRVDPELVAAIDHLHREGLVQFPEINIVDLESVSLEQAGNGMDRADTHFVRFTTRRNEAAEDTERLQPFLRRELVAHDHSGTGAVRELARIAAGNGEAWPLGWLDASKTLGRGIGTWPLVG